MVLSRQTVPNAQRLVTKVRTVIEGLGEAADAAVLFMPSYKEVVRMRKNLAEDNLAFGLEITTFPLWIQERWDLYGDGRCIISRAQRELLIYRAFLKLQSEDRLSSLVATPGTVATVSAIAQECLTVLIEDDFSLAKESSFTEAEKEVAVVLECYVDLLDECNLCEQSQAIMMMTQEPDRLISPLLFAGVEHFTPAEEKFIEILSSLCEITILDEGIDLPAKSSERAKELIDLQSCIFDPDPQNPVKPTGAVSFLLPSGRYALPRLLMQDISECIQERDKHIGLSSRNPESLFNDMVQSLHEQGISASLAVSKPFKETGFGKAWIALFEFLSGNTYSTFQLSDVVVSAFSAIELSKAQRMDALWRGDRNSDKARCIKGVSEESAHLSEVITCIETEDILGALAVFEQWMKTRFNWSDSFRSEQLSALSAAREVAENCEIFHVEHRQALPLLSNKSIQIRAHVAVENPAAPLVEFMEMESLAQEEACSFDTVFICDMDSVSYPVKNSDDAKTRFFSKLDVDPREDALGQARRTFHKALSTMKRSLVCERTLFNVDANEVYPSVMFEELIDCYRNDLTSVAELDRATGLPRSLMPFVSKAGESDLYENLIVQEHAQVVEAVDFLPEEGCITEISRGKIALPHRPCGTSSEETLCLSPSAIESYLECPYKWFALRRLRLEGIDAGFGPLEMGSFAHRVLKAFYLHFQESNAPKVTDKTLSEAKNLFSEIFDQHVVFQPELRKNENPLIALSALEEAEIDSLKRKMVNYLEREAALLPGFIPRYFEHDFGDDAAFEYAGCMLHGSVDRIDVNDKGQAVVIDYKGSVSPEYALRTDSEVLWVPETASDKPLILPNKIQALMYAQAVRKTLNLEVVGTFYVSYGRDGGISGAYDPRVLGVHDLSGINPELCTFTVNEAEDFSQVLDNVEESLARVVACLRDGYIKPQPRGKDPCGYCPVTACRKRKRV